MNKTMCIIFFCFFALFSTVVRAQTPQASDSRESASGSQDQTITGIEIKGNSSISINTGQKDFKRCHF